MFTEERVPTGTRRLGPVSPVAIRMCSLCIGSGPPRMNLTFPQSPRSTTGPRLSLLPSHLTLHQRNTQAWRQTGRGAGPQSRRSGVEEVE